MEELFPFFRFFLLSHTHVAYFREPYSNVLLLLAFMLKIFIMYFTIKVYREPHVYEILILESKSATILFVESI